VLSEIWIHTINLRIIIVNFATTADCHHLSLKDQ